MTYASSDKYSRTAIILHWIIAVLVIGNIAGAMLTEDMARETRGMVMGMHKAFGILILFLAVVRVGWRLTHRPPAKPAELAAWEVWLARTVHFLFYALLILLPLSGWVWMSAAGKPIDMFGIFSVPALPVSGGKELADVMHERHETLGLMMLGLVLLHVAGALKHQLLNRLPYIQRMWP